MSQKKTSTVEHDLDAVEEAIFQFALRNSQLWLPPKPNGPLTLDQELQYNIQARKAVDDHITYVRRVIKEAEVEKDLLEFLMIDLENIINNPNVPATGQQIHDYIRGREMKNQLVEIIDKRKKEIKEDDDVMFILEAEAELVRGAIQDDEKATEA